MLFCREGDLIVKLTSLYFVTEDMDQTEEVMSTAEVDDHVKEAASEKTISKRQLKLQKRREEWLTQKAERR